MLPARSWLSPPTRREVTLLIFSLTVFVLSYNLETSLRIVGVSPSKLSSSYLGAVLQDPGFERDGRRPQGWRDELENTIAGEWVWEQGEIAGVKSGKIGVAMGAGTGQQTIYNVGKSSGASRSARPAHPGVGITKGVTVDDQYLRVTNEIPETRTVAHVPGYTILDNLFIFNGSYYIVTDSPGSIPPLASIASSSANPNRAPPPEEWRVLTTKQANETFGTYISRIRQTTWLSTEAADSQDPYTLFSLFRAHVHLGTLQQSETADGYVPPPVRLWFPRIPVFSSPSLPPLEDIHNAHPPPRQRAYTGLHASTIKAVLPTVGLMYEDEWQDYADMRIPYLLERVLVADRSAARRNRDDWSTRWVPLLDTHATDGELRKRQSKLNEDGLPAWAAPFVGLDAPDRWWAPARASLLSYLGLPSDSETVPKKSKAVVTLVSMDDEPYEAGAHIGTEDYPELIAGLNKLVKDGIIGEFHVVKSNGTKENWEDRMKIITRTDILMGAFGNALADSLYMPAPLSRQAVPTPKTQGVAQYERPAPLVMEFWPTSVFLRDREFSVRTLGMRYTAWWDERKFVGNQMPPVMNLHAGQSMWVTAVVPNILEEIKVEAKKWS